MFLPGTEEFIKIAKLPSAAVSITGVICYIRISEWSAKRWLTQIGEVELEGILNTFEVDLTLSTWPRYYFSSSFPFY